MKEFYKKVVDKMKIILYNTIHSITKYKQKKGGKI